MGLTKQLDDDALVEAFRPVIERHGLALESLKSTRVGQENRINVVVDLPEDEVGSADLDTVTDVSRALSELMDADDSLTGTGSSNLEVTTPGVFRPLTELRHFKRSRTRLLNVTDAGGRQFVGRLTDVVGDDLVFDVQRPSHKPKKKRPAETDSAVAVPPGPLTLPVDQVRSAEVQLEFR